MATSQHINPWFWTPWCPKRIHAAPTRSMTPICFFCQSWLVDTHSLVVNHLYFTILTFLLLVRRLTHACCDVFCSLSALVGRLTLSWWESFPYCSFSVLAGRSTLSCCDAFCSLSILVGRLTLSWWESFAFCYFFNVGQKWEIVLLTSSSLPWLTSACLLPSTQNGYPSCPSLLICLDLRGSRVADRCLDRSW
jgi:hypothetical protein